MTFLEYSDFWNRNFMLFPNELKEWRIPETDLFCWEMYFAKYAVYD